jgi:hypothetical protein
MGEGPLESEKNIGFNHILDNFASTIDFIERVSLWQFYVLQGGINSLRTAQSSVHCTGGGFFSLKH